MHHTHNTDCVSVLDSSVFWRRKPKHDTPAKVEELLGFGYSQLFNTGLIIWGSESDSNLGKRTLFSQGATTVKETRPLKSEAIDDIKFFPFNTGKM